MNYLKIIISLVAITTTISPLINTISIQSSNTNIDCLYLLVVLEKIVDYTLQNDPSVEYIIDQVLDIRLPAGISTLHTETYNTIREYHRILTTGISNETPLVYDVITSRPEVIYRYIDELEKCSRDVESAAMIGVSVESKIGYLEERVRDIVEMKIQSPLGDVVIEPSRDIYEPGDVLAIIFEKKLGVRYIYLYTWPDLRLLRRVDIDCSDSECVVYLTTPTAIEIEKIESHTALRGGVLSAIVVLEYDNGSRRVVDLVKTMYTLPNLEIYLPRSIDRRTPLDIVIISSENYRGVLFLNNTPLVNLTIHSGLNRYVVNTSLNIGINNLKICVNATTRSIPYCYEHPFIVRPVYPNVEIKVDSFVLNLLGQIPIVIRNNEEVDLHVEISGTLLTHVVEIPRGEVYQTHVLTNIFPVQKSTMKIKIIDVNKTLDVLTHSVEVVVVNVASIVIITLCVLIIPIFIGNYENAFTLMITLRRREVETLSKSSKTLVESLLEPYRLGLGSNIALSYYQLIRKLKFRLPHSSETLREHVNNIIISHSLSTRLVKLLLELLELIERELYSSRKPQVEDVAKVYEDVLSAISEE